MQRPDIRWRGHEEALEEARRQRKPILLSLTAAWCSADGDPLAPVAGAQNLGDQRSLIDVCRQFVFARVDVERRPDVYHRYEPADLPSTLLLGPDGEVLLGDAARTWSGAQAELRPGQAGWTAPAADLRPALAAVEGMLLMSFDEIHGGFGVAPKHPEGYALAYAVDRHQVSSGQRWQEVFTLSLDGITRGLFDAASGGFYRSAEWRDWQVPTTAKLLGINAEVIRAYVRAYEVTQRTGYLDVANRSLQFVLTALRGPAFFGSVAPGGRLDRTIYLPPNEEMIGTLLLAAQVTGEADYADHARQVQRYLLEHVFDPERGFAHYYDDDGAPHLYGLLLDNAAALVGLARTYAALLDPDYLAAAVRTAELILSDFFRGADLASQASWPAGGVAFQDGVLAAEGLLSLGRLTGSARYCRAARQLAGVLAASLAGQRAGALARFGSLLQSLLEVEAKEQGSPGDPRQERGPAR